MAIIERCRKFINYIFIFSTINDNFIVDNFGSMSLKILFVIFAIMNINSLLSFKYGSLHNAPFFCLAVAMLISLLVNLPNYTDIISAINLFVSISMIFIVFSQEKEIEKYMWCYVISALFSAFLCITAANTISEYTFRKTGGTGDPNEFSITILIPLGFLLGRILKVNNIKEKIGIIAIILVYSISLLFAGSKSAILSLALFIVIFIGYILISHKSNHKILLIGSIILILTIVGLIIREYYGDTLQMVVKRFSKVGTANERFISWKSGYELFKSYPFFGVGLGNYETMIGIYFPSIVKGSKAAHNMYVQALVELGIGGFLAYIWFILSPLYKQVKYRIYPLEFILGFIPFILMGFTLSLLLDKYVWIFYAFLYNRGLFVNTDNYEDH